MMKTQAYNPYLPQGVYIPDGEPHVFGKRVYLYGSQDKCGSVRYCPGDYVVWSAPIEDLSNWTNKGVSYPRRGTGNKTGFHCLWAPDCTRGVDGRYYLYYCFNFKNKIHVAVSDLPDGPFEYYGFVRHEDGTPYGSGPKDIMCFDPGVFTDEDGQTYLYSGYSANEDLKRMLNRRGIRNVDGTGGQVVKLQRNMLTVAEEPKMLLPGYKNSAGTGFEGHEMYEASSLRKINGKYYFIYSSRLSHELCYAVSDYPDKDFRFGGTVVSNGDIGLEGRTTEQATNYWGNVHGSIEQINGKWYVFYHRQTNKNEQSRQSCAEPIEIEADGTIRQAEMTSCGLNGKPLAGEGTYPAYIACHLTAAKGAVKCAYGLFSRYKYREHPCITEYKKGRQYIQNLKDGAVVGFKYFDIQGATEIKVKTSGKGGKFLIRTSPKGQTLAVIELKSGKLCESAVKVPFKKGKTALYFVYSGEGKTDFYEFTLKKAK